MSALSVGTSTAKKGTEEYRITLRETVATLPAGSSARTKIVFAPSTKFTEVAKDPLEATFTGTAFTVREAPGSVAPATGILAAFVNSATGFVTSRIGATVSMVTVSVRIAVLPARSSAVAVIVWVPSANGTSAFHAPEGASRTPFTERPASPLPTSLAVPDTCTTVVFTRTPSSGDITATEGAVVSRVTDFTTWAVLP